MAVSDGSNHLVFWKQYAAGCAESCNLFPPNAIQRALEGKAVRVLIPVALHLTSL
jgi:hypothetical protein